ncbi:hypothetical protein LNI94_00470 [Tenacibaculum finnmarkense genomovar ulcerans]|uniref:hypothetical protein n=1 Tax=Tenacibaculum finnmarkense TaxID=2781243 RepID=UPI001E2E1238|nr:hypothetical protein [Tenacibaculum finnmarkense]MCD8421364.1 hypothetical protein [Tenacibaculum finnmarkense genomovar ulcerans]
MYKLYTFENIKIEPFKNLTKENFEHLKSDCEIIKNAHRQLIIFKHLQLNGIDYSDFMDKLSNIPVNGIDIIKLTNSSLLLNSNKIILNLLSSFTSFLDNGKYFLSRKYGRTSNEYKKFNLLIKKHTEENFAFRFLKKFRNYIVHLGFPLKGLSFEAEKNIKNPEKMIGKIILSVSLETLQKERRLFDKVHLDLMKLEDDIDLKPLIDNLSLSILEIQSYIYKIQKEEIENAIENIETFIGNKKKNTNLIKVCWNLESNKESFKFNSYDIPFDMISDFKIYKKGE